MKAAGRAACPYHCPLLPPSLGLAETTPDTLRSWSVQLPLDDKPAPTLADRRLLSGPGPQLIRALPTQAMFSYRSPMSTDPTIPKRMPKRVERELLNVLGWRGRPNPIDLYNAIRDALLEAPRDHEDSNER